MLIRKYFSPQTNSEMGGVALSPLFYYFQIAGTYKNIYTRSTRKKAFVRTTERSAGLLAGDTTVNPIIIPGRKEISLYTAVLDFSETLKVGCFTSYVHTHAPLCYSNAKTHSCFRTHPSLVVSSCICLHAVAVVATRDDYI